MGKALATVGTVITVAAGVALAGVTGGLSLGVSASVLTAVQAAGTVATLVGSALIKKPGATRDPSEWVADTDGPIPFAFGRIGVAGKINYASDGYGADNRYTSIVSTLSGAGPIKSFVSFASNDVVTTFGAGDVATSGEHAGAMWLQRKLGTQPQAALTSPAGLDGGATVPEWGSAYGMSGRACSMQTLYENSKFTEFQGGEEKPLHILEGKFGWDPVQDSTYPGGSGSCRLLIPSTWVWIDCPILAGLNWSIGMWEGAGGGGYGIPYACSQVGGIGASLEAIDVPAFVYASNVAKANGWKIAAWPDTGMDESTALDLMLQAGGALRARVAGKISCISRGAEQASLLTVTVKDTAGPVEVALGQSRLERINTIVPRIWSEEHGWEMTPGLPVSNPAWVTEDRGAKRSRGVDYPYAPGFDQGAQLAYYDIADNREPISGSVPFKPHMRRIKPGDCFTFSEPGLFLDGIKVKCLRRAYDPNSGIVRISFRQETDAKHDAAMAQTGAGPVVVDPNTPPTPPVIPTPTIVSDEVIFNGGIPRLRLKIDKPSDVTLQPVLRWRGSGIEYLSWVVERPLPLVPSTDPWEISSSALPADDQVFYEVGFTPNADLPTTWTATASVYTTLEGARRPIGRNPTFPLTSDDDSISIAAFDAYMADGTTIEVPAGSITGLAASTPYGVFWRDGTGFEAEVSPAAAHLTTGGWLFVGWQATSDAGGVYPTTPTPPGGWGGDGPTENLQ